ncbi:MAG: hypothetical protein L3J29_09355 [Cyclobacteriaceae bacterium]|nr:hypothetical protein [Cyclobacteriaceae bacterium]
MKKTFPLFITLFIFFSVLQKSNAQELSLAHYVTAKEYVKKGNLDLALIELDSAIKIAPNFGKGYGLKGEIYELKNEDRKAIGQYSLAILHSPNKANFYLKRASLHFKLKDHRDYLLNDINKVIRLEPENADLLELKAFYYAHTFNPNSLKRDYKNAISELDKAILLNPAKANYFYSRSDYKLKDEQNLSSLLDVNKAIEMEDSNASYYYQRARIRFVMSDFRSSLNDINQAIALEGNSIVYFQFRGNIYYNLKRYNQAYESFSITTNLIFNKIAQSKTKVSVNSPLNLTLRQTLLLRGMSLVHSNKPYDGCDDFNRALKMGESKAKNYIKQYCN